MEQAFPPNPDTSHVFPDFGTDTISFLVADRKYALQVGRSCQSLLAAWEDELIIMDSDIVEPGLYGWYSVNNKEELNIDPIKSKLVTEEVARVLTDHSNVLLEISSSVLEETTTSKFITLEDVLEHINKHGFITSNTMAAAIALFLSNPRLQFFNNGVVANSGGDVFVLDEKSGWTEASALLLALAGIAEAPRQERSERASAFSYGAPRGCGYEGKANRAVVENVPVSSQQDPNLEKWGFGGDGRYADRKHLFFRSESGKWRKVYLEGNLMFVSGMRGRSIVGQIPVKALEIMGVGFELREGQKGLEVPTNAMFDLVVRCINAGNQRLSMWFTPKVLRGEITICKGPRTMTCFFRSEVDLADVEFGPTIRTCILQSGVELGYVVNVGTESFLLAHPYDSHGFIIRKVGHEAYHTDYCEVPALRRYMVEDASKMFFGALGAR